ncbi:iron chelate uptake ABC transporter, FeCT family, permease protein [Neisseria sicca ATCC 29256]|uniref:Iron chelate uptake ABC transporter, FeCT family, permease protein n=1 Tax=Neisseria sicca ATCC 29256 TaxID=547045 RepID=C6M5E0_NEISI|nr:iron chelate uptake ABC transporter, FeCT family, permease protein [Neisseria sicca ATCC 29256]
MGGVYLAARLLHLVPDFEHPRRLGFCVAAAADQTGGFAAGGVCGRGFDPAFPNVDEQPDPYAFNFGLRFAVCVFANAFAVALGGVGYTSLPLTGKFGFELVMMMGGSLLLFYTLIRQGGRDLSRMILIGVIFGILFRSLSSLLTRMIDPEEFTAAQANMFANFNTVHSELLGVGALILLASAVVVWRERHRLDVHLLGRDQTINLGINYTRNTLWLLLWIAALVATATAVVGPVSFFGLLAAALANHFAPSVRHSVRLPMTVCVGGILLVGGQTVFEHLLGMKAVLSVVVEFAGGLVFLYLVLKRKR